ncbi:hypothetical protein NB520_09470 [Vibrio antiquarius]|uniref:hypothetical protein n=1 Tax=Vibrio antiquarius (strain Ex25) TaxID=150340 RepID=UPI00265AC625|nr:hypothetical protein [Vibrio antiquarius]MCR9629056.1 hypothetical protein [Vibrio antiquarius]MCR9631742.1 hypothetical protein [Vibrio antiquarius]
MPEFKRQQGGDYRLNNVNNNDLVSCALKCISRVSPHLEVTECTLKVFLKQCISEEVFIESVQRMFLHQRMTIEERSLGRILA